MNHARKQPGCIMLEIGRMSDLLFATCKNLAKPKLLRPEIAWNYNSQITQEQMLDPAQYQKLVVDRGYKFSEMTRQKPLKRNKFAVQSTTTNYHGLYQVKIESEEPGVPCHAMCVVIDHFKRGTDQEQENTAICLAKLLKRAVLDDPVFSVSINVDSLPRYPVVMFAVFWRTVLQIRKTTNATNKANSWCVIRHLVLLCMEMLAAVGRIE